ncbi:low molecular weight protein-tyrosine-phosphatase [Winogradskyella ursingii]|uniref:low molecular weight protein-tyrosine-phosphatase n=1 Tax=Winogradskyella ursingii TaxID=2686079 RepID=UPI0015C9E883|nr:low molecular weight protein-tyrosine-phosphatase [Winogradskyella ursingii]
MTRILMVCLGNICRSPLAHGILQSQISNQNFHIDSAGTGAYHIGNPPDPRSISVAKKYGLDISNQKARQFKAEDFDAFDIIYAMDKSNYDNIIKLARTKDDVKKVKLFLDENPLVSDKNVPDPYYGGEDGFETVYNLVANTCKLIVKKLNLAQ